MKKLLTVFAHALLSAGLVMTPFASFAKTTTWIGAEGAKWNVAGNWDSGVPESGDTVCLTATSSDNDLTDLTLASLQLLGDTAITLSGNAITLTVGAASVSASGSGTKTIAAPLVLPAGESTIVVGDGTRVSVTGVISGAGALKLSGANVAVGNYQSYVKGEKTWPSVIELRAANTYAGGTTCDGVTVDIYDLHAFGAEETEIVYGGYGMLWFRAAGDFRYDITGTNSRLWLTFSAFPVTFYGDIENEVSGAQFSIMGIPSAASVVNFRGTLRIPTGSIHGGNKNIHTHFYGPVTALSVTGNGGAFGSSPAYWHFHETDYDFDYLQFNAFSYVLPEAANVWPSSLVAYYIDYSAQSVLDLNGYHETIDRVYTTSVATYPRHDYRTITSSSAATLTCQATANANFFNAQVTGAATLEWAPLTARTLTLTEIDFTGTSGLAVSNGTVSLGANMTFGANTTVSEAENGTLTISDSSAYTVKYLYKGGIPQKAGVACTFGSGTITATDYAPFTATWTGGAGADTSVANAQNWGGTLPSYGLCSTLYTFASGGSAAALAGDFKALGLTFSGVGSFAITGTDTLTVGDTGVAVAAGTAAEIAPALAFVQADQSVDVASGASLVTRGSVSSGAGLTVTKTGAGTWRLAGDVAGVDTLGLAAGTLEFPSASASVVRTVANFSASGVASIVLGEGVTLAFASAPTATGAALVDITAPSLASVRCTALAGHGPGKWLLVNGKRISFDADGYGTAYRYDDGTDIAANGGVIPTATETVRIATDGTGSGGVTLAESTTAVGALAQAAPGDATVSLTGEKTLSADRIVRLADAGTLAIGASSGEGTLTTTAAALVVENEDTEGDVVIRSDLSAAQLVKYGAGALVLASPADYETVLSLREGTVALAEEEPRAAFASGARTAEATLAKDSDGAAVAVTAGDLAVSGDGPIALAGLEVASGATATVSDGAEVSLTGTGRTSVGGTLTITNATYVAYDQANPQTFATEHDRAITVGRDGDGILRVQADTVVTNRLVMGTRETGHTGDGYQAAAYFDGGETVLLGSKNFATGVGFQAGYGTGAQCYTKISGGAQVTVYDSALLQYSDANSIVRVDGGSLDVKVLSGTVYNQTRFDGVSGTGLGALYVKNGTYRDAVKSHMMDQGVGQGVWTVAEGGSLTFETVVHFGYANNHNNTRGSILNVKDGGQLTYYQFSAPPSWFPLWATNAVGEHIYRPVYLNLNGGTLNCQNQDGTGQPMFNEYDGVPVLNHVIVYEKGITVNQRSGFRVRQPFEAPTGMGVTNIPWTARAGFVAPPSVWIDGDGYGASAIAEFDESTGTVTGFEVTSHGCDYTWARAHLYRGPTEFETVDCQLAENVRTGAVRFGGTVNHMVVLSTHGPWTVGEVVFDRKGIFRFMQETDDVFSTNTIVTMTTSDGIFDGSIPNDWTQYSSHEKHRMQVGTIRGTKGHVLNSSDNFVHASFLDLAGSGDIGFYGQTLSVEGSWTVDAADLVARRAANLDNGLYKVNLAFAPTARIAVENANQLERAAYVLAQTTSSYTLAVDPQVLTASPLPDGWRLLVRGKQLLLKPRRGVVLFVK